VATRGVAVRPRAAAWILDLPGGLGVEVERLPGYEGIDARYDFLTGRF